MPPEQCYRPPNRPSKTVQETACFPSDVMSLKARHHRSQSSTGDRQETADKDDEALSRHDTDNMPVLRQCSGASGPRRGSHHNQFERYRESQPSAASKAVIPFSKILSQLGGAKGTKIKIVTLRPYRASHPQLLILKRALGFAWLCSSNLRVSQVPLRHRSGCFMLPPVQD